jgi:hypothetical protein
VNRAPGESLLRRLKEQRSLYYTVRRHHRENTVSGATALGPTPSDVCLPRGEMAGLTYALWRSFLEDAPPARRLCGGAGRREEPGNPPLLHRVQEFSDDLELVLEIAAQPYRIVSVQHKRTMGKAVSGGATSR